MNVKLKERFDAPAKQDKQNSLILRKPSQSDLRKPDTLTTAFQMGGSSGQNAKVISKELFKPQDIKQRTRISINEITLVNRGFFISDFMREKGYNNFADKIDLYYFGIIDLRPSLNGLSREEFVKVHHDEVQRETIENSTIRIK